MTQRMSSAHRIRVEKSRLRSRLQKLRRSIPAQARISYSRAIAARLFEMQEVISARAVFVYISYGSEVDTHNVISCLLANGKLAAVPKIVDSKRMAAHQFTNWDELRPAQLGILSPTKTDEYRGSIDVAITPGLGFTLEGHRIGFGAGYYDRWFSSHSVNWKVALAFEAQLLEYIPTETTDVPVDAIVTEKRCIRIKGPC